MSDISVCIGTFGAERWSDLARERACASADRQVTPALEVIHTHVANGSLQDARNTAALRATGEWLCFVDADDELDENYVGAMQSVVDELDGDWLVQPATAGVHPGGRVEEPTLIPACNLVDRNYLVIGTLIRSEQFRRLGGFGPWPMYEDWDLWLRAWMDGAQITAAPQAVYRVHVNHTGRNNAPRRTQVQVYNAIRTAALARQRR